MFEYKTNEELNNMTKDEIRLELKRINEHTNNQNDE